MKEVGEGETQILTRIAQDDLGPTSLGWGNELFIRVEKYNLLEADSLKAF